MILSRDSKFFATGAIALFIIQLFAGVSLSRPGRPFYVVFNDLPDSLVFVWDYDFAKQESLSVPVYKFLINVVNMTGDTVFTDSVTDKVNFRPRTSYKIFSYHFLGKNMLLVRAVDLHGRRSRPVSCKSLVAKTGGLIFFIPHMRTKKTRR